MPVPSKMADLYTIASSNSPSGSEAIGNSLDDYLRSAFSILRSTNALSSFTLASASTVDLGTADAEHVQITGTVTIASFGTSVPGLIRECRFTDALTITASTNIITPNSADIVTAAGDVLTFRSMGAGVWRAIASGGAALLRDGALSIAKTSGLQASLDAKASLSGANFSGNVSTSGSVIFAASSGVTPAKHIRSDGANLRITNDADSAYILTLSDNGDLTIPGVLSTSQITATGNGIVGGPVYAVLSPSASGGNVFLRPNGLSSATGQATLDATGLFSIVTLAASGAITGANITLGGGKKISKVTLGTSIPATLADGELYLQY